MKTVPGFNVEVRRDGAAVLVAPTGEVDLATEGALRDALDRVGRCEVLVLDLRGISFMDSAGIAVLVDEHLRAEREGFRLRVISGPEQVQRVLEMTGLARRLDFTEPGEAAEGQATHS